MSYSSLHNGSISPPCFQLSPEHPTNPRPSTVWNLRALTFNEKNNNFYSILLFVFLLSAEENLWHVCSLYYQQFSLLLKE